MNVPVYSRMIFLHRSLCIPLHLYTKIYINVRLQEQHSTEQLKVSLVHMNMCRPKKFPWYFCIKIIIC